MKLLAVVVGILSCVLSSTPRESVHLYEYKGSDTFSAEISNLLAPVLFQNGFEKIMKQGHSGILEDKWYFEVKESKFDTTFDHCSELTVEQKLMVLPIVAASRIRSGARPDFVDCYTVDYMGQYENVLEGFDERSKCGRHTFTLLSGTIQARLDFN